MYTAYVHHALYIEGPLSLFEPYLAELKPFFAEKYEKFGVDDARALIEQAQLKNFGEATFFVAVGSMTSEAQQALLKLFEEPQAGTTFILLAPHGTIIPTLRSRMMPLTPRLPASQKVLGSPAPGRPDHFVQQAATSFLKSSQKERSDYIAKLLKNEDDAREQVRELLNSLEAELHSGLKKAKQKTLYIEGLEDISRVRGYTNDRSPSLKMLMEHLALTLPHA